MKEIIAERDDFEKLKGKKDDVPLVDFFNYRRCRAGRGAGKGCGPGTERL